MAIPSRNIENNNWVASENHPHRYASHFHIIKLQNADNEVKCFAARSLPLHRFVLSTPWIISNIFNHRKSTFFGMSRATLVSLDESTTIGELACATNRRQTGKTVRCHRAPSGLSMLFSFFFILISCVSHLHPHRANIEAKLLIVDASNNRQPFFLVSI